MTNPNRGTLGFANPKSVVSTSALVEHTTLTLKDLGGNGKPPTDEGKKVLLAAIVTVGALIQRFALSMNTAQLQAVGLEFIRALKRTADKDTKEYKLLINKPCIRAIAQALFVAGGSKLRRSVPGLRAIIGTAASKLASHEDPTSASAPIVLRDRRRRTLMSSQHGKRPDNSNCGLAADA